MQRAGDPNAVATHDGGLLFAILSQEQRFQRIAVFCSQLEHVADFDRAPNLHWMTAFRARLAFFHQPEIGPLFHLHVAIRRYVPHVITILIRPGGHAFGAAQALVRVNRIFGNIHRSQAAGMRLERVENLVRSCGAEHAGAERARELRFV